VQHIEEVELVPLGLIGQRWGASMFISAQQECFCCTITAELLGRTGVNEATLIARKANITRTGVTINRTIS